MTDDLPTLDLAALDRLLEMTGGDPAFVEELIETFLDDAAKQLAAMNAAATLGAADDLIRPSHSLKSNSASVGAMRLSEMARALEAASRDGDVAEASARVAAASSEFERVREALKAHRAGS